MGKNDENDIYIKCPLCEGIWDDEDKYESHLPCPAGVEMHLDKDYFLEVKEKLGKDPDAWIKWLKDHPEVPITLGLVGLRVLLYFLSIPIPLVDKIINSVKKR